MRLRQLFTPAPSQGLTFIIAGALAGASFSAWSVQPLTDSNDTSQLRAAGTVSVSRASNLDDLQDKLAEKARQEGAKGFVVNAAGGDNCRCCRSEVERTRLRKMRLPAHPQ